MKSLPIFFKQFVAIVSMAGLLLWSFSANAKEKKWANTLAGSAIQANAVVAAQDGEILNYTYTTAESATYVELKIDDFLGPFNGYRYTVALTVTPILYNGGLGTAYPLTLSVENNKFGGTGNFRDLVRHKVLNSYGASVKVVSVSNEDTVTNAITSTTPANVSITVSHETKRYYNFDDQSPPDILTPVFNTSNEVVVKWSEVSGAEEYELAWAWVDNYGADYGNDFTILTKDEVLLTVKEFEQNCTRIQTGALEYKIPLVFDNGYLVFRIRAIGRFQEEPYNRLFGMWNITPQEINDDNDVPIPMSVSFWDAGYNIVQTTAEPLLTSKNWQFQASYAEGGKKKDVVSYFDGSLRNRQTVTKINTAGTTIVGEVIYDEEGRPAIEVLPAPSTTSSLTYKPNFNVNMAGKVYSFQDFLSSSNVCNITTQGMKNTAGASLYYSPGSNTQTNQDFVPVAENFPFSQIEYTLDNTGRVKRKGGVGPKHQLGTNREMKYFYSVPAQHELNRLFGYNVGWASHYKKNIVIDPNKQVSVSYLDPQGRTIATALGAEAQTGITPLLESNAALHPNFNTDLLNKLTVAAADTPLDNNNRFSTGKFGNLQDGLRYSSQKVFTENSGIYTFDYTMKNTNVFTKLCNSLNYTYPFMYMLKRKVMDECGTDTQGASFNDVTQVGTYTKTSTGYASTNNTFLSNTSFPLTLPGGSYEVSKELTVNEVALNVFADDYIERGKLDGCILQPQAPNANIDGCFRTCQSCTDYYISGIKFTPSGGTELTGQAAYVAMMKATNYDYLQLPQPPTAEETNLFNARFIREHELLLIACNDPCKKDGYVLGGDANAAISSMMCDNSLDVLLADMLPNGQYGVYGSDIDEGGNVLEGNEDMAISQLPLSVYNDNMVETTGVVANKVFAKVNGIDDTNANWRNPHYYDVSNFVNPGSNNNFKHYFTPSGKIDYVSIQWDADTQKFTPPLVAAYNNPTLLLALNSDLAVDPDAGRYKAEPQYLANVDDFIAAIASRQSWALSLVKYHPEFHYLDYVYKMCGMKQTTSFDIDPAITGAESITFNSDGLDAMLGSCKTYNEAVTAGFLQTSLSIFNFDPFFQNLHPLDATIVTGLNDPDTETNDTFRTVKRSIMKNALDVFTGTDGDPNAPQGTGGKYENTGLIMAHYIYKTIKCNGLAGNCPVLLPANATFANIMSQVATFTPAEKDLFWHYYVSYYVGLKQKIRSVFLNTHALRQGFYNDCIGNDNSENVNAITAIISKYPSQRTQVADWLVPPQAHTLHSKNGQYLKDKEKRFQPFDELYDSEKTDEAIYQDMKDDAGSYYLSSTGNCPRILDLTIFLENFLKKEPVVVATAANFNENYLTPDLFKALGGFYDQNPSGPNPNPEPDHGDVKVSSSYNTASPSLMTIQFTQTNPNPPSPIAPMVLTISANSYGISWNNVKNATTATTGWKLLHISELVYIPPAASGSYTFKFLATVKRNNIGDTVEVIITGTTKAVLACSTDPGIAASQGSVYVNPHTSPPCTKKEDFTKGLKDLIVSLQNPASFHVNDANYNLLSNSVYSNGYLPEFFGTDQTVQNIRWKRINTTTYSISISVSTSNPLLARMVISGIDLSTPLASISIGDLTATGDGHTLKVVGTNGTVQTGVIKGNEASIYMGAEELKFACCALTEDANTRSIKDFKVAIRAFYNELLHYVDTHQDISIFLTENNGYVIPYNFDSVVANDFFSYFLSPTPPPLFTVGGDASNGFTFSIFFWSSGTSGTHFDFSVNELSERIADVGINDYYFSQYMNIGDDSFSIEADNQPLFLTNGNQGVTTIGIKYLKSFFYLPKCPCIPQTVQPVICKQKYDLYVAHLTAFGLTNNLAQVNTIEPSVNFTAQQVFCGLNYQTIWDGYSYYLSSLGITNTEHPHYISLPAFGGTELNYGYSDYNSVINEFDAYLDAEAPIYLGSNSVYYASLSAIPAYINNYEKVDTWVEYAAYYVRKEQICPPTPLVPKIPIRFIRNNDCLDYSKAVNETYNADAYETYINSLKDIFKRDYLADALSKVVETFNLNYSEKEYQYTLYYYDQAGNLIQTVAPEGVGKFNLYTNPNLNNTINSSRNTNTDNTALLPNHSFKTQYRYNSLNQLVWQSTPDGGEVRFAYDKLGRIVASQNSNQIFSLINNPVFTLSAGLSKLANGNFVKDATGTAWIGGNTTTILPRDGYVQYTIYKDGGTLNNEVIVGLSYVNASNPASVRYAFRVQSLTSVYTRQNLTDATTGIELFDGDVLKIERLNGRIRWYVNKNLILEVTEASPNAAMLVDLAIATNKSEIRGLKIVRYDLKDKFSYTRYDALGRIKEAGQMDAEGLLAINDIGRLVYQSNSNEVSVDAVVNFPHNVSNNQIEVTKTLYDTYLPFTANDYLSIAQRNTRGRVAAILTYENANANTPLPNFETAILYNYDIHGNVNEMVQVLSPSVIDVNGAPIKKRVNYEYDLISGNVNKVIYQKNSADQFIHKYDYDADNRITSVQTSKDNVIWETDAAYKYYDHGPLARVVLGDKKVQGIDYAYTLHGWLKTVNSESMTNSNKDMGRDGNIVSKDAFAYSLSYFNGDYAPKAAGSNQAHALSVSNSSFQGTELFNGNINRMITSLRENRNEDVLPTQVNLYKYDQLNRIFSMHSFKGVENSSQSFTESYGSTYDYDRNGNLKSLTRRAPRINPNTGVEIPTPQLMDSFTYNYQAGTNKLTHIDDSVLADDFGSATHNVDIDDQEPNNYTYDGIGQLIGDNAEKIRNIFWRADGKVKSVEKNDGHFINFYYDGLGNRVAKNLVFGAAKSGTHYTRDAQGNVLGVYDFIKQAAPIYDLREHHIYGSSRLGLQAYDAYNAPSNFERIVGDKRYELTNHLGNVLSVIDDRKIIESDTQLLSSDTFDSNIGAWIPDGSGSPQLSFYPQTRSLRVTASANDSGAKKTLNLVAGMQVVVNIKVSKSDASPIMLKIKYGAITMYTFPIANNENTTAVFIAPATGTFSIGVALNAGYPSGSLFYIDDFYAYSIPLLSTDYISLFVPNVLSYNDYYPFGMLVPNRHSNHDYRYGFNGKEKDDEIKGGEGNSYDFGARLYDSRVGRWHSTDNVIKAEKSSYQFAGNNPIVNIDPDGEDEFYFNYLTGVVSYRPAIGRNKFYAYVPGQLDNNKKQIYIPLDPHDFNKGTALKDFTMTYTEQTLICWPFTFDRKNSHWESIAKFVNLNPEIGDLMGRSDHPDDKQLNELIKIHNGGLNLEEILTAFADGYMIGKATVEILPALPKLLKTAPKIGGITIKQGGVIFDEKATAALFQVGTLPSFVSIKNGVGKVTIGFAKSLTKENLNLVEGVFKSNGAHSMEIMTGIVKPKIKKLFDQMIKQGKTFNGYKIEKTPLNPLNNYKLTKEIK